MTKERKLSGIKQRIARLSISEMEEIRSWLATKVKDTTAAAKEAYFKSLQKAKPGDAVVYQSNVGTVRKVTKTYVSVVYDEEIPLFAYRELHATKGARFPARDSEGALQLLAKLPGFGAFQVYASANGKRGNLIGRTPAFGHALHWAFDRTSPDLAVEIVCGDESVTVDPKLRAQYTSIRQQLGTAMDRHNYMKQSGLVWDHMLSPPSTCVRLFKEFMKREIERVPEELR